MSKLTNYLNDPGLKIDQFAAVVFETALRRNEIVFRTMPNGTVWACDRKTGLILLGLV